MWSWTSESGWAMRTAVQRMRWVWQRNCFSCLPSLEQTFQKLLPWATYPIFIFCCPLHSYLSVIKGNWNALAAGVQFIRSYCADTSLNKSCNSLISTIKTLVYIVSSPLPYVVVAAKMHQDSFWFHFRSQHICCSFCIAKWTLSRQSVLQLLQIFS